MFINRLMDKEYVLYMYTRILFKHKKRMTFKKSNEKKKKQAEKIG